VISEALGKGQTPVQGLNHANVSELVRFANHFTPLNRSQGLNVSPTSDTVKGTP